jgi:twitching motility two-component system response regulator PilH
MGKTVLVVDDHPATVALVRAALEEEGFSVLSAVNGAEGLAQVEAHSPDLVILDLNMPVMGGIETLRRLRLDPKTHLLPVIIATVQMDQASVIDGWMSGAERYLQKPLRVDELLAAVKQLLPL